MRFTQYLIESRTQLINEKHELVLQKVIDGVDDGHVEYSDSKIVFDIGEISETPKLRGLQLVIRAGSKDDIKLGRTKEGNHAIVIDTTGNMPGRQEIDTFLASKTIYAGFQKAYTTYVQNFFDHSKEYDKSDTETKLSANTRESFEEAYSDLIHAISEHNGKYTQTVAELDKELEKLANTGRKKAIELAKENLRDEYLGKSDKEFISKAMALPEAAFAKHLDKDWKAKLESRLTNYYNSKYMR